MARRKTWSIRARTTLTAGAIVTLICAVLTTLLIVGVHGRAVDYQDQRVSTAALRVVHVIKRERLTTTLPEQEGTEVLQVLDPADRVIAATRNVAGAPPIASFKPTGDNVVATRRLCPPHGLDGCMNVASFRVYQRDGDWTVYSADYVVPWYVSADLCLFLISSSLLLILLAAIRTWRTVDQTLAPVDAIRSELAEITVTDPSRRVTVPDNRDEIRLLAETANATLDRLGLALERQRRFTSDASHDLRSPIAGARAQLEEALMFPDEADWPRTGRNVLASLDRLQAIVTDLLELARLDADAWNERERVDLAALVTIELTRSVRGKDLATDLGEGATVRGDRLRLARLLTNLLDNAERHAAARVEVRVRVEDGMAVLEVADDGEGIDPADREVVFQRFARLKDAKERDADGTGLGLPIAREIARAHGGTLTLEDSPKGALFVLRIPLESAAPRKPGANKEIPGRRPGSG
ncbi:sensor histidine kinase [Spirillospora sp. CA-294931]|uniref:sensor histidine kinase n=1 Tax=Spirillospora sp. CA-294931 TaxID=3240042 RepID=UPI003D8BC540